MLQAEQFWEVKTIIPCKADRRKTDSRVLVRSPAVPGSLRRVKPGTRDVFSKGRTCFEKKSFSRIIADH